MRDVMHWMWDMQEPQASYLSFVKFYNFSAGEYICDALNKLYKRKTQPFHPMSSWLDKIFENSLKLQQRPFRMQQHRQLLTDSMQMNFLI